MTDPPNFFPPTTKIDYGVNAVEAGVVPASDAVPDAASDASPSATPEAIPEANSDATSSADFLDDSDNSREVVILEEPPLPFHLQETNQEAEAQKGQGLGLEQGLANPSTMQKRELWSLTDDDIGEDYYYNDDEDDEDEDDNRAETMVFRDEEEPEEEEEGAAGNSSKTNKKSGGIFNAMFNDATSSSASETTLPPLQEETGEEDGIAKDEDFFSSYYRRPWKTRLIQAITTTAVAILVIFLILLIPSGGNLLLRRKESPHHHNGTTINVTRIIRFQPFQDITVQDDRIIRNESSYLYVTSTGDPQVSQQAWLRFNMTTRAILSSRDHEDDAWQRKRMLREGNDNGNNAVLESAKLRLFVNQVRRTTVFNSDDGRVDLAPSSETNEILHPAIAVQELFKRDWKDLSLSSNKDKKTSTISRTRRDKSFILAMGARSQVPENETISNTLYWMEFDLTQFFVQQLREPQKNEQEDKEEPLLSFALTSKTSNGLETELVSLKEDSQPERHPELVMVWQEFKVDPSTVTSSPSFHPTTPAPSIRPTPPAPTKAPSPHPTQEPTITAKPTPAPSFVPTRGEGVFVFTNYPTKTASPTTSPPTEAPTATFPGEVISSNILQDAFVTQYFPTTNFGDREGFVVSQGPFDNEPWLRHQYSFLQLDVSSLVGRANHLDLAQLRLYVIGYETSDQQSTMEISLYQLDTEAWNENNVTWSNRPNTNPSRFALWSGPVAQKGSWMTIDFTDSLRQLFLENSPVQEAVSSTTFSIAIVANSHANTDNADRHVKFGSKDNSAFELHPTFTLKILDPTVPTAAPYGTEPIAMQYYIKEAAADTWMSKNHPNATHGTEPKMLIGYGDGGADGGSMAMIKLDLRPLSGDVKDATLTLRIQAHNYIRPDNGQIDNSPLEIRIAHVNFEGDRATDDVQWDEDELNWANSEPKTIPDVDIWRGFVTPEVTNQKIVVDMKDYLNSILSLSSDEGGLTLAFTTIAIVAVPEAGRIGNLVEIKSIDFPDRIERPRLEMSFIPRYQSPFESTKWSEALRDCHLQGPRTNLVAAGSQALSTYPGTWFYHLTPSNTIKMSVYGSGKRRSELFHETYWDSNSSATKSLKARLRVSTKAPVSLFHIHHLSEYGRMAEGPLLRMHYQDNSLSVNIRTSQTPKVVQTFQLLENLLLNEEWLDVEIRIARENGDNILKVILNGHERIRHNLNYWKFQYNFFTAGANQVGNTVSFSEVEFQSLEFSASEEFTL